MIPNSPHAKIAKLRFILTAALVTVLFALDVVFTAGTGELSGTVAVAPVFTFFSPQVDGPLAIRETAARPPGEHWLCLLRQHCLGRNRLACCRGRRQKRSIWSHSQSRRRIRAAQLSTAWSLAAAVVAEVEEEGVLRKTWVMGTEMW